jgi:predicted nucleic acid-binding protein
VNVLVDTPIWSLALRRSPSRLNQDERRLVDNWAALIREGRTALIGPVRQEVLSGLADTAAFERLRVHLRAFEDEPLSSEDFEQAARCHNACRAAGVAGSSVDFLICAVAMRRSMAIFTTDADFSRFARQLPLRLFQFRSPER